MYYTFILVEKSKEIISRRALRDPVFLKMCFLEHCLHRLFVAHPRNKVSFLNYIRVMLHTVSHSWKSEIHISPLKALRNPEIKIIYLTLFSLVFSSYI